VDAASYVLSVAPAFMAYYLTSLGQGFFEKSGVLNLSIDGVFVLGIAVAYAASIYSCSPWVGLAAAVLTAVIFGILLTYVTTKFPVSHGAVGLSIMFLGYGLAGLVGVAARNTYNEMVVSGIYPQFTLPVTPIAKVLMFAIPAGLGILLYLLEVRTKLGAAVRAVGEDPHAATSLGIDVLRVRLIAAALGYSLIGAGSAGFLTWVATWSEGTGINHGWIAYAVSLAAGRHPLLTVGTAGAFAILATYMYTLQAAYNLSPEIAKMIPFIVAIGAMVTFMSTPLRKKLAPPQSLGKRFFKEERTV